MTFGQRLKQLLTEHHITQRQLSESLNIASSTLNGYANDYREPDFGTLISLADYFGISVDYLLGNSEIPNYTASFSDEQAGRLMYYYGRLSPRMKKLLIAEAQLLLKHDPPGGDDDDI
mgnify:FL=1